MSTNGVSSMVDDFGIRVHDNILLSGSVSMLIASRALLSLQGNRKNMNREQVRTAIWLALITCVISLLSAYAQTDPNSAEGWLIQSRLMASLWLESLPLAAILVLILATPWYLVKLFKRLRSKQ
ncbi:hypothetical protein [Pseudomonas versuta]|nr:hypothetical protein [Pseudomonas versuta]